MITLLVDLANMDGNRCDWSRAHAVGVRGAYLRDCFSTSDDQTYELEAPRARAANVKPGPYMFPDLRVNAIPWRTQVASFVANVKKHEQPGDLPAAFDVEFSQGTRGTGRTRVELLALIVEIAVELRAGLGYWPLEYSSKRVIDGEDTDALDADGQHVVDLAPLKNCPFWASRYITNYHVAPIGDTLEERRALAALPLPPIPAYLGDTKNVWLRQTQGDSVGLDGFTHTVDIDVFYAMVIGETGERVRWAQQRLGMVEGTPGVFDTVMAESVRAFQAGDGLDVDEVIGLDTWSHLAKQP